MWPAGSARLTSWHRVRCRRSVGGGACRTAADGWKYPSIELRRLPAVAIFAPPSSRDRGGRLLEPANSRPRPSRAELDANAETRLRMSYEPGAVVATAAAGF